MAECMVCNKEYSPAYGDSGVCKKCRYGGVLEIDMRDPTQHEPGAKLDAGKTLAGVLADFSGALTAVAEVGTMGAEKYTRGGWQHVDNGVQRYTDAMWRHLLQEQKISYDGESGLRHAAHMAWNALARLELIIRENDNAPRTISHAPSNDTQ